MRAPVSLRIILGAAVLLNLVLAGSCGSTGKPAPGAQTHSQDVEEWFEGRIERLTSDSGYLSLVGLFKLEAGTQTFGSREDNDFVFPDTAPLQAGAIKVENGRVFLAPDPGVKIRHEGELFTGVEMFPDTSANFNQFTMDTYTFYVIERMGPYYLRVKDTNSEYRRSFTSIERYPVDEAWRVPARFERYPVSKSVRVPNVMGYDELVAVPGTIVFEVDGVEYSIEPMSSSHEQWWLVFGDETSGRETYGGGRFVYIPAPDENGNTHIDFNKAYNPPCAFNPYATCPLPHPDNILPVAITAGEKTYEGEHH